MSESKITVCVPTYNRAELLRQTLHSLLDQGLRRDQYTVAISDNASVDDTREVVRAFADVLNIEYHRNESNIGMLANCIHVLSMCHTPYMTWLPDDDLLAPGQLQRALSAFEQCQTAVMVASLAVVQPHPGAPHSYVHGRFLGATSSTSYAEPFHWDVREWLALAMITTPLSLIGTVFGAEAFRRCSRWQKYHFWADRMLLAELALEGDVVSLPWVGGYYRVGPHQANARRAHEFVAELATLTQDLIALAGERGLHLGDSCADILASMDPYDRAHYLRQLRTCLPKETYTALRRTTARKLGQTTGLSRGLWLEHPGLAYRADRLVATAKHARDQIKLPSRPKIARD